jgi:DNA-binding NarL/FixJ family response regulator
VTITPFPSTAESREVAHQNWAAAVRAYRSSLDLYRHAMTMRARREVQTRPAQTGMTRPGSSRPSAVANQVPALRNLTPREREVVQLMACGYTNQQIADTLVLTRGTVANHVAHILGKLGVSNRTQVAALVFQAPSDAMHADDARNFDAADD